MKGKGGGGGGDIGKVRDMTVDNCPFVNFFWGQ